MKLKLFYRISDKSFAKPKLPGINKKECFYSFLNAFWGYYPDSEMCVIADRCSKETMAWIEEYPLNSGAKGPARVETDLGNSGSLRYAIELCCSNRWDHLEKFNSGKFDAAFFSEDDYLYTRQAKKIFEEGLEKADYISLFDHPDKYTKMYDGGETSKVFRTASTHWKTSASTCMSFGTRIETLREDKDIFMEHTQKEYPNDHQIFTDLKKKGRTLAVCIPGQAYHTDLTEHLRMNLPIEQWVLDLACEAIRSKLSYEHLLSGIYPKNSYEYLTRLAAIAYDRQ